MPSLVTPSARDRSPWRPRSVRRQAAGLVVATLGAAAATPLAIAIAPLPGAPYYVVAFVAAWLGRLGAGSLSVAVSTALVAFVVVEPRNDVTVHEPLAILVFALLAGGLVALVTWIELARGRAALGARQLRYLAGATAALEEPLDGDAALRRLAAYAVPALGDGCVVRRVDPSAGALAEAAAGDDDAVRAARGILGEPPSAAEARTTPDGRPAAVVALAPRGRPVATMAVVAHGGRYEADDLEVLDDLARRASVSIATLEALDASRLATDRALILQRFAASLSRAVTVEDVAEAILRDVVAEIDARAALIALVTDDGRELEVVRSVGYDDASIAAFRRFPVDARLPMSEAVRERAPLVVRDIGERTRRYPALDPDAGRPDHTLLCLPMMLRDAAVGGMSIGFRAVRDVGADELAFLEAIARLGAAALRRALLYRDRDRVATTLQRSLLPRSLPTVDGLGFAARYRPGEATANVGGDFYDVLQLDGRLVMLVGDVCGSGVEAASTMGMARFAAWGAAADGADPASILATVNEVLLRNASDDRFVTMCVGAITRRPSGVAVAIASGGHPLPLVLSSEIRRVGDGGPLLGTFPGVTFPTATVELRNGEALLFYTDGIAERSGRHVFLDEDVEVRAALRDVDPADADAVAAALDRVIEAGPALADDVAVLVLSVARA